MDNARVDTLVHDTGYGIISRKVMRDKNLSIESKAIYSYLISFAGTSNRAFPSVELMLEELDISRTRFYKYMKELKDNGFVKVEQEKENNRFKRNVYYLIDTPVEKSPCTSFETTQIETTQNEYTQNEYTRIETTQNRDTNNNNLNNNKLNNNNINNNNSAREEKETVDSVIKDFSKDDIELLDSLKAFKELRDAMKSKLTPRAMRLNLKNLKTLSRDRDIQIAIINQSVMNSWKGFYPIKDKTDTKKITPKTKFHNFKQLSDDYSEDYLEDIFKKKRNSFISEMEG